MQRSLCLLLITLFNLEARIIRVPFDYPTIQQGLNAAGYGDTVIVAQGRYMERITWPVVDGITLDSETGATSTIIDADTGGSVILIGSGITNKTIINGFTICRGKATSGAGIRLNDASPIISNNWILNNIVTGSNYSYGGGIYCGGSNGSSPVIYANLITGNKVLGTNWNHGGGIYIGRNSNAIIAFNTIEQDSAIGGYWNYGAGIYCDMNSSPTIYQNLIRANIGYGGDRAHGSGIYVSTRSFPVIFNNLVIDNRANSGYWNYGAGLRVDSGGIIINNTIASNVCTGGTWNYGGGIFLDGINNYIYNNIIVNNQGGGIYNYDPNPLQLIDYNNVWNNSPTNYYNCTPGPNDRSRDPLFVAGTRGSFYLSQIRAGQPVQSPCVDSGGPLNESLMVYIRTSTTRTDSVPDSNNVDMGYHYPIGQPVWIGEEVLMHPTAEAITLSVAPNPFRMKTKINFPIGQNRKGIELKIYDISGKLIKSFYPKSAVLWSGDDDQGRLLPRGVYFIRLSSGNKSISQKVIILR